VKILKSDFFMQNWHAISIEFLSFENMIDEGLSEIYV